MGQQAEWQRRPKSEIVIPHQSSNKKIEKKGDLYFKSSKGVCISSRLWNIKECVLQISQEKSLMRSIKRKGYSKWQKIENALKSFSL